MRTLLAVAATVMAAVTVTPSATAALRPPSADFDGDGHADLAVGAPSDSVAGQDAAGAVSVLYGDSGGLTARRHQQFTQASPGVSGAPEPGDRFGATLVAGDFDGDGYADLAVGVPGEGTIAGARVGVVQILHGSPHGLIGHGEPPWWQGRAGVKGTAEGEDNFAVALAAGDFDATVAMTWRSARRSTAWAVIATPRGQRALWDSFRADRHGRRSVDARHGWGQGSRRPENFSSAGRSPPATSPATAGTSSRSGSRAAGSRGMTRLER